MKRSLDVMLQGGAAGGMPIRLTSDVELEDEWPPTAMQVDMHGARWTYVRLPGTRTLDGEHLFVLHHRETAEMVGDYGYPPDHTHRAEWERKPSRRWFG